VTIFNSLQISTGGREVSVGTRGGKKIPKKKGKKPLTHVYSYSLTKLKKVIGGLQFSNE
jgi:hypothetical protein